MGSFPLSIVPRSVLGREAQCAWAPEPVFTLEESARLLGVTKKTLIKTVRRRFPEVKFPAKVVVSLTTTFGPSLTDYGEVHLILDTPGGPQEHICLSHVGLFRHAVYIRTPEARRFVFSYPDFVRAICLGQIKPGHFIHPVWLRALMAPWGNKNLTVLAIGRELGFCRSNMYKKLQRIRMGEISDDGGPLMKKRGRPSVPASA